MAATADIARVNTTAVVITRALQGVLDNKRTMRERADDALCVSHGLLALAILNNEVGLAYIADFRKRVQLVLDALENTEAAIRGAH